MGDPVRLLITEGAATPFIRHVRECSLSEQFHLLIRKDDSEAALCAAAAEADAILCYQARLPASVIHAAPALKFIQKHGLNCRNIDVAAATDRGVPVATLSLMRSDGGRAVAPALTVTALGAEATVTLVDVELQPFASVTVTLYVPAVLLNVPV